MVAESAGMTRREDIAFAEKSM